MEICDVHHHLGSLSATEGENDPATMDRDYQNRVAMMTDNKVDFVALLASTGYIQADGIKATMRQNDAIAAYRARDPKRFPIAAGIVEPLHGSASLGELERIKQDLHLDGV